MSIVKRDNTSLEGLEAVLLSGDLGKLSPDQRVKYYAKVCETVGLNPLTQPFEYLTLQGKCILYARRACTDQLRKVHGVSVTIVSRERMDGLYVVTARATMPDGRCDESIGAVPIEGLKGEALSNAFMKSETKAKRRVTLAICGLSMMDESELEGVKDKVTKPVPTRRTLDAVADVDPTRDAEPASVMQLEYDQETGEVTEPSFAPPSSPCPIVQTAGKYQGVKWSELPNDVLHKIYMTKKEAMSKDQRDWAEYLLMKNAEKVVFG